MFCSSFHTQVLLDTMVNWQEFFRLAWVTKIPISYYICYVISCRLSQKSTTLQYIQLCNTYLLFYTPISYFFGKKFLLQLIYSI